ncbi:hypothetical protein DU506_17880 [Vreelandella rituensis]|uniref:Uncharacterized protein n=1 Tax=Vreelandella rituensis TaxID=2282306 RepID=A0A368TQ86_9GAMM|nr:hypothetical protein DU506_17880 [Halomonas rituensis]
MLTPAQDSPERWIKMWIPKPRRQVATVVVPMAGLVMVGVPEAMALAAVAMEELTTMTLTMTSPWGLTAALAAPALAATVPGPVLVATAAQLAVAGMLGQ